MWVPAAMKARDAEKGQIDYAGIAQPIDRAHTYDVGFGANLSDPEVRSSCWYLQYCTTAYYLKKLKTCNL
jgi:hypothetical protein